MSKIQILLFFFCCQVICTTLRSQDKGDELWKTFAEAETDSIAFSSFSNLYMYNIGRDLDRSKELLVIMDSLCQAINFEDCRPLESLFKGYYYRVTGSYDTSIVHFKQTYDQYKNLGNESKMAVALFNLGVVTSYKGDYEGAVQKYILARDLYEKVGNINGSINVSNSIGIIYKNIEDYEKAKVSYSNAEKIALESDNQPMLAMIYNNISNLYHKEEGKPDSVLRYAEKALALEKTLQRNTGIASAYNLISAAYIDLEKKEQALINAEQALNYSKKSNNKRFIAIHEMGLADILKKSGNNLLSEKHYRNSIALADSINLLDMQVHGYKNYAELLTEMGKYKQAYAARLQYEKFNDSLSINDSKAKIAELETQYETALKDKKLDEQKLELYKKTYQRNLFLGGMGFISILGATMVWGLLSRNRRNKKIANQEQDLSEQKIQTLEQEKKLLSMSSILEGQENERIRIAKDLHDGLGGLLTNVKAHFGKIQSEIQKVENLDIYNTANLMIDKAYDEVRRISHNLMPSDLRAGGLPVAIRQLVHELKTIHETKTDFEMIGFNDDRINEKIELSVYRIMQELINNILKYANADTVFIQLSKFEKEVQIVVEDDGIGFDFDQGLASNGLGLKSILSRVEQLKGHTDIVTSKGNGTSFTINIPLV